MSKLKYNKLKTELEELKQELAECVDPRSALSIRDAIHEVQHEMFRCGVDECDQ